MGFWHTIDQKGWYFLTHPSWWLARDHYRRRRSASVRAGFRFACRAVAHVGLAVVRIPAIAYIEFFRGTPALVQLFVIYFGFPDVGFQPSPLQAAIIGLGLNGAAYLSEIYRAGIESIHRGRWKLPCRLA